MKLSYFLCGSIPGTCRGLFCQQGAMSNQRFVPASTSPLGSHANMLAAERWHVAPTKAEGFSAL